MELRETELDNLLTEVSSPAFLTKTLGFTCSKAAALDLSRLVVMGVELGGLTALSTAAGDKRVKAVAAIDPWFSAYHQEVL